VLISNQVNIWREIVEHGAGMVEGDTEEGVEKLLKKFLNTRRGDARDLKLEVEEEVSHGLGKMDEDGAERPAADRTEGNASCRVTPALSALSAESLNVQRSTLNSTMGHRARECYLKRFAIGPAAAKLAEALSADN